MTTKNAELAVTDTALSPELAEQVSSLATRVQSMIDADLNPIIQIKKKYTITTPPVSTKGSITLPDDANDDEVPATKTIRCAVIFVHRSNAEFEKDDGKSKEEIAAQGKQRPVCSAPGGVTPGSYDGMSARYGVGSPQNPTGLCQTCPRGPRQWWTLNGKGAGAPPCGWKQMVWIVPFDKAGNPIYDWPCLISVAPTATKSIEELITSMEMSAGGFANTMVEVSVEVLDKVARPYSKFVFKRALSPDGKAVKLTSEQKEYTQSMRNMFIPLIKASIESMLPERNEDEIELSRLAERVSKDSGESVIEKLWPTKAVPKDSGESVIEKLWPEADTRNKVWGGDDEEVAL